jgi:hypothetical protein
MAGGRPTHDPKETLLAVRLAARHVEALRARAQNEGVGLSEALRRCIDDWVRSAGTKTGSRSRPPTSEERKTFDEVFAAFGLTPRQPRRRRARPR